MGETGQDVRDVGSLCLIRRLQGKEARNNSATSCLAERNPSGFCDPGGGGPFHVPPSQKDDAGASAQDKKNPKKCGGRKNLHVRAESYNLFIEEKGHVVDFHVVDVRRHNYWTISKFQASRR